MASIENESNPLQDLKLALLNSQKNTATMLANINSFDHRLSAIESEMQPLQNTTAMYSRAKENIGLTLLEVEKTYEYFRIKTAVEGVIAGGLNMQNIAKQKEFFNAISRLTEAKRFFEAHKREIKSSASELDPIEKLLTVGGIGWLTAL